ncbi:hypothetical protein AN931_25735 [Mycobacterium intracellulare subsp. chimaera]|uniref:hypothetical protein n=1 Tax=Mycobacterium intracellulare TaxID=1767 RepID=UPI0006CA8481|nr:hypothetical protein [Mycobacterium intracellulare]KPN46447.1 hypothetical protein AN931_25735 [Mycobacterium intracellulare subsp. chimaera]KPN47347.1 hypothetical protein AN933_24250 [Mycobacterium intracellulare subsp. chimaera]MDM3908850.1 hypothetical protein [Mycobacterium intracellulare subsp. chimaera]
MSLEHIPTAILTATLVLRVARIARRRALRALIRTTLLTAALAGALLAGSGHTGAIGSLLTALPLSSQ